MKPAESSVAQKPVIPGLYTGMRSSHAKLECDGRRNRSTGIPVLIMGECGTGKVPMLGSSIVFLKTPKGRSKDQLRCLRISRPISQLIDQPGERQKEDTWGTLYLDSVQDLDLPVSGPYSRTYPTMLAL